MSESNLDASYWENRFRLLDTPWDTGSVTQPLKSYFDQLKDKKIKILIPGAGNAYEAEYLNRNGFQNVYVLDISQITIDNFKSRVPEFNQQHMIRDDFFNHTDTYDLIIEQTFFCALHPKLRLSYVKKMHQLLSVKGKLVGLLFNDVLNDDKPPFGGNFIEYRDLFSRLFNLKTFEKAYNSIAPRAEREIFMILQKINAED